MIVRIVRIFDRHLVLYLSRRKEITILQFSNKIAEKRHMPLDEKAEKSAISRLHHPRVHLDSRRQLLPSLRTRKRSA